MIKAVFNFLCAIPIYERRLTISTIFTLSRIVLTPIIVASMVMSWWGTAFLLFVVAAISDFADGYVARLRNEQTYLGACLDPIADKILLFSIFLTMAFIKTPFFMLPWWFIALIGLREIIIVGGAFFIRAVCGSLKIQPTLLGKLTTAFNCGFMSWLFASYYFRWNFSAVDDLLFASAVFLAVVSLLQYIYYGTYLLQEKRQ